MRRVTRWEDIRPGDVWSVRGYGWISRAIRFFSAGDWNHSGLVLRNAGAGGLFNLEALESVRLNPLSSYRAAWDRRDLAVYSPDVEAPVLREALSWIADEEGGRYGWISTASLAVVLPLQRILYALGIRRQVPTPFRRARKCSELVLVYVRHCAEIALRTGDYAGYQSTRWAYTVPDLETFTPHDLVTCCEAHRSA